MTLEEWTNFLSTLVPWRWQTGLYTQIATRKLQAVHGHAAIAVVLWVFAVVALVRFRLVKSVLPHMLFVATYIFCVGFFFFGPIKFMHKALSAPGATFVPSVLQSWLLAALPLAWVYISRVSGLLREM